MSWWAVVVGFAGALLGGLLGTLATISHERSAEMRSRQLNAAEGFITAAPRSSGELRVPSLPTAEGIIEGFSRASEAVVPHVSLVQLLFGLDSLAAGLARTVSAHFVAIADLLARSVQPAGLDHREAIERHHGAAFVAIADFGKAASDQVQQSAFARALQRRRN